MQLKAPRLYDFAKGIKRSLGQHTALSKLLGKLITKSPATFTFFQAGGHDGVTCDPFREFIIQRNSRGIIVEPQSTMFDDLSRNYRPYGSRIILEQCAVGYGTDEVTLYSAEPVPSGQVTGSTLVASLNVHHVQTYAASTTDSPLQSIKVPCRTIEALLHAHGMKALDFLFLDIEGAEANILLNLDYQSIHPRVIVFEHIHLGDSVVEIEALLRSHGYHLHHLEHDTIAERK